MNKKLYKSNDRVLFGVCGGFAEYFQVDVVMVRILWVVSVMVFGIGFLPYIICAIVMPEKPKGLDVGYYSGNKDENDENYSNQDGYEKGSVGKDNTKMLGFALICVGGYVLLKNYLPIHFILNWKLIMPIGLIVGGGYMLFKGAGDNNE